MGKKLGLFLVALLVVSSTLFAAGAQEIKQQPQEITVVMGTSGNANAIRAHLAEFEAKTNIKVNLESYAAADVQNKVNINGAAGGTEIDVFAFQPITNTRSYQANGYFAPLNDYIAASKGYDYEDFFPSSRLSTSVDGVVVGIPYMVEGLMMWYNKDILDRYKVSVPTTFKEMLEVAKKVYDPANNVYAYTLRGQGNNAVGVIAGFLYGFGANYFDKDMKATMNTPEALAAIEFYADLCAYGPPGMKNIKHSDGINWFNNGLTAFRIDSYAQSFNHNNPEKSTIAKDLGYAMLPKGEIGTYTPFNTVGWAYGISATSQHKDAAWKFIEWASGYEMEVNSMVEGGFSARSSVWEDARVAAVVDPQLMEVVKQTGEYGYPYSLPNNMNAVEVRALIGEIIDAAQSGLRGAELKAVADKVNVKIQTILDSEKK
jgi:multiple sugar transport system substrate-binding protein